MFDYFSSSPDGGAGELQAGDGQRRTIRLARLQRDGDPPAHRHVVQAVVHQRRTKRE